MPSTHARPRALASLAGLLAGGAALVGCSSTHSSSDAGTARPVDVRRAEFPIDHASFSRIGYRLDWVGFPAVTGSESIEYFHPYSDIVVVQEGGSIVTVLEQATGARRCADQLANPLTNFVGFVREGDNILCASDSEVFVLNTQTCELTDRQQIQRLVATPPVMFGNLLIFGCGTGEVLAHLALPAVGGVKAWGFLTSGAFEYSPVLMGNVVGAVSQSGEVVFLEAQNGSLVGRTKIFDGVATDPVTDGNVMFVASLDQSIYAIAPTNATILWRYRTASPLRVQPTVSGDRLYCDIPGRGLTAFETGTGNIVWTTKNFHGTVVAVNKNRLVAWDGTTAALIDPARGDIIDSAPIPGAAMLKPDKFVDGNLYVVSKSGVIAKFLIK